MPIRGFDQYSQAPSTQKLPISVLSETIIAIDGFWYLKKYMPPFNRANALNLQSIIHNTLSPLVALSSSTQILWIWDGLDFEHPTFIKDDLASKALDAVKKFETNKSVKNLFDQEIFVEVATKFLELNKISVIRAPYLAMAQCVYFLRENCVKYVFTKSDALLFKDGNKVVIDINYDARCIEVLDRAELLKLNNLNLQSLQMLSFLSGCELVPTIPLYASEFSLANIFDTIRNGDFEQRLLKLFNMRTNSSLSSTEDPGFKDSEEDQYIKSLYRAFLIVEYHPVMTLNGKVEPIEGKDSPTGLETIFGLRLPDIVYQDMFKCNITPKILNKIIFSTDYTEKYKQDILSRVKKIIENGTEGREILVSERIKQLLNLKINWATDINRMVQILTLYLSKNGFYTENMIKFINSGYMCCENTEESSEYIKYEDLLFYLQMTDIILIFSDLVKTIGLYSVVENDLNFDFSLNNILRNIDREPVSKFLNDNSSINSSLMKYKEIINNKNH